MTQATKDATARACWKALMNYSQADMDGVFVTVSRQAIHECKEDYDTLRDHAEAMAGQLLFLKALMAESRGVAGYHLNGDEAPWQEFDEFLEPCAADAFRKDFPKGDGQ